MLQKEKMMPEETGKQNVVTAGFTEVKDVLLLMFVGARAYEKAKADGEFNLGDLQYVIPVLLKLYPAIENFDQVKLELLMATPEEKEQLKIWIQENLELEDDQVEKFIEASFAVMLDLWMLIQVFFFPQGENKLKFKGLPIKPKETIVDNADGTETKST